MSDVLCSKCQESIFRPSPLLPSVNEAAHLASLLRSNLPPTDSCSVADAKVEEGLMELARYDDEIRRIQSVLSGLKAGRERLQDHLERIHSAHNSPIRMVPNEILAEIMYEAMLRRCGDTCALRLDTSQRSWSDGDRPFIRLSEVCYRWHQVAVSTPKLWAQIRFASSSYYCERDLSLVSESLRRSGSRPLSINQLDFHRESSAETKLFLDLILPHASRIQQFSGFLGPLLNERLRAHNLEALEVLDFTLPDEQRLSDTTGWVLPRLRRACFRAFNHWSNPRLPELPWAQISSFSYSTYDMICGGEGVALPWSDLAPGASFNLLASSFRSATPISSNIAELTCSISAQRNWNERDRTSLGALFSALTLPRLQTLRVLCPGDELSSLWSSAAFNGLAKRSGFGTTLKHLAIEVFLSEQELFAALQSLSALETLALRDMLHARIDSPGFPSDHRPLRVPVLITDEFLRRLHLSRLPDPFDDVEPVPAPKFLPNLRSLTLTTMVAFSDTSLLGYLDAQVSFVQRHAPRCSTQHRQPFSLHIIRVGIPRRDTMEDPAFWGAVQDWMDAGKLEMTYRTIRADAYIAKDPGDIDNLYEIRRWHEDYGALLYEAEALVE